MIIGTAGHIDHGKTALVRALTGVDADRLPEEKRRGMTIDLGFAYRTIPAAGAAADELVLGFVDVPGHERFVHNMLAGATGIDFVLLVVAADDGPMPQTREHLEILSLLGLARGVVALTKADLVSSERLAAATEEVRGLLAGSSLRDAEILPVSSITGQGIAALETQLTKAAGALGTRAAHGEFRLAIDRSFVLPGVGVVVTGTVAAGSISVGDRAVLTPSGIEARIRGIHAHNRVGVGGPGRRALRAEPGRRAGRSRAGSARRMGRGGAAACAHRSPRCPAEAAAPRWQAVESGDRSSSSSRHRPGRGAARPARPARTLAPDAEVPAQLVLERPIGAWRGDRFILRDASASRTLGGGVVLDPYPPARGRRRPERLAALAALALPEPAMALAELLRVSPSGVDLDRFALAAGMTPGEAEAAWREAGTRLLKAEGQRYGFGVAPARFETLRRAVRAALAAHHQAAPDSPGLERDRLRLALPERLPPPLFRSLVTALVEDGTLAVRGASIHLPGHVAALPAFEERLWGRVRLRLEESRLRSSLGARSCARAGGSGERGASADEAARPDGRGRRNRTGPLLPPPDRARNGLDARRDVRGCQLMAP